MEGLREEASPQLKAVSFQGRLRRGQSPCLAMEETPHPARPSTDGLKNAVAVHPPQSLGSDGPIRSDQKSDSPRKRGSLLLLACGFWLLNPESCTFSRPSVEKLTLTGDAQGDANGLFNSFSKQLQVEARPPDGEHHSATLIKLLTSADRLSVQAVPVILRSPPFLLADDEGSRQFARRVGCSAAARKLQRCFTALSMTENTASRAKCST